MPDLPFRCFPMGRRGQAITPYSSFGMSITQRCWKIWIPWRHTRYIRELPVQKISPFLLCIYVCLQAPCRSEEIVDIKLFPVETQTSGIKLHQFCIPCAVWELRFQTGKSEKYKSKLVQSCSPVKSVIISENKRWGGLCQMISLQSVLLFSGWVHSQSRENWEKRHGLSQGKLRIQPAQPKQSRSRSCIAIIHLDFIPGVQSPGAFPGAAADKGHRRASFLPQTPREGCSGLFPCSQQITRGGRVAGKQQLQADAVPTLLLSVCSCHSSAEERA